MRRWFLLAGVMLAALLLTVVIAVGAEEANECSARQRQLEVVSGPVGWTATGLVDTRAAGDGCRDHVSLAFYAPGDTWENEGWAPVWIDVAELPHSAAATRLQWEPSGDRIAFLRDDGEVRLIFVESLPTEGTGGQFRVCDSAYTADEPSDGLDWDRLSAQMSECVVEVAE